MKKLLAILVALALVMPMVLAVDTGTGIGIDIETEDFVPLIWGCDARIMLDDNVEEGRHGCPLLFERQQNYIFEGEQLTWLVLVMDKNGIEKIKDVYVSVGDVQGSGSYIEANCNLISLPDDLPPFWEYPEGSVLEMCNARIDEELLTVFDPDTMGYYLCYFTAESSASMHGEYWVTANVVDLDDQLGSMDEHEYWFFNPAIALTLGGLPLSFGTVRPGTTAYSNTLTVGNGAEVGSGVMMDMFISGTDFTDPTHSGAKCPDTNQLRLNGWQVHNGDLHWTGIRYYATNGAYSSFWDLGVDIVDTAGLDLDFRDIDAEGYMNIEYGDYFQAPQFYDNAEIIQNAPMVGAHNLYYSGNILSPGSEMSVTFAVHLPVPCNGDFNDGSIYFWGEAI